MYSAAVLIRVCVTGKDMLDMIGPLIKDIINSRFVEQTAKQAASVVKLRNQIDQLSHAVFSSL